MAQQWQGIIVCRKAGEIPEMSHVVASFDLYRFELHNGPPGRWPCEPLAVTRWVNSAAQAAKDGKRLITPARNYAELRQP
jgi:hypothetical protein